jgi:hypothetical protein
MVNIYYIINKVVDDKICYKVHHALRIHYDISGETFEQVRIQTYYRINNQSYWIANYPIHHQLEPKFNG